MSRRGAAAHWPLRSEPAGVITAAPLRNACGFGRKCQVMRALVGYSQPYSALWVAV